VGLEVKVHLVRGEADELQGGSDKETPVSKFSGTPCTGRKYPSGNRVLRGCDPRERALATRAVHPYSPLTDTLSRGPVESGQYVSLAFGQAARDAGIAVSIGSRGDCYDNAVAESLFSTLKKELIRREGPFATRADLRLALR
jgi:transposase InsO family protein